MHAFSPRFFSLLGACAGLTIGILLAADSSAETVLPLGSRLAVCFPPDAPVFGDAIPDGPVRPRERQFRWSPPELLADYVNEAFYPPLSTRLMDRSLRAQLLARLEEYRERRGMLLEELADQMLTLQGAETAIRESELRAFAVQQNPQIVSVEREAEALRRALIDGGLFQTSVDWSKHRRWRMGATRYRNDQAGKEAQFQVIRAAAYYENGFTIEQRGLLLELAAELQVRARAARPIPLPRTDDPAAIFFSPAMSRFRLPKNATPRLTVLLGRFNGLKGELKQGLREAVFAQDRAAPRERAIAFEALAEREALRLAELEKLADEIRAEMAVIPRPPLLAGPQLPAALVLQIETYRQNRRTFIEEFEQAVRAAMDLHRSRVSVRPVNEMERAELARLLAEGRIGVRAKVAQTFRKMHRERYEEMHRRYQGIQRHLEVLAAGRSDAETGKPLTAETLLRGYADSEERFNAFGREEVIYKGYWHAMMMPGLSPEQRRLLFGAAWVGLAQPLPAGEPMPTGSQPTPRS